MLSFSNSLFLSLFKYESEQLYCKWATIIVTKRNICSSWLASLLDTIDSKVIFHFSRGWTPIWFQLWKGNTAYRVLEECTCKARRRYWSLKLEVRQLSKGETLHCRDCFFIIWTRKAILFVKFLISHHVWLTRQKNQNFVSTWKLQQNKKKKIVITETVDRREVKTWNFGITVFFWIFELIIVLKI